MTETKDINLERIIKILTELKAELKEKYGIKEIGIFGSYVKGKYKGKSDLDILVEFEANARISLLDFVGLENYLCDLLRVKVDLVEKSVLKPRIGRQILKELVTL